MRQKLDDYVKNIPPHVRAARIADEKNKINGRPLQYQNKGSIQYIMTLNGPEPIEYQTSAIDYEHYIEKQLQPIADAILPFIGLTFDDFSQSQFNLF